NVSEEEKEIIRENLDNFVFHLYNCDMSSADDIVIRQVLSGMVYWRLEIHPIVVNVLESEDDK
ncbi:hypothetical protein PFISCL1PPCAC_24649, partial [Pristionchus fissidentatus]